MILPIGDSPNPPGTPWITYLLIGANVAIFLLLLPLGGQAPDPGDPAFHDYIRTLAEERQLTRSQALQLAQQTSEYDLLVFRRGFRPASPSLMDILTSMFLHGGLMHLFGNMLFLWIYGDNVEHRLGRWGFLLAYLATGAAACLGDGLIRMGSDVPSVGASGAISGVLGLYFLWFPRNRVRLWFFFFPFLARIIEVPARVVLGFYVVVDNLLPLVLTAGRGSVSYGAHIGGFAAGLALAFVADRFLLTRPEADVRRRPDGPAPAAPAEVLEAFRAALGAGRWDVAAEWFFRAPHSLTRHGVSGPEKIHLGRELERNGHPHAALGAYQRALADHARDGSRAAAHLGAARVLMGPLGNPTGAYQHLYAALEEEPTPDEASRAREMLQELSGMVRTLPRNLPG